MESGKLRRRQCSVCPVWNDLGPRLGVIQQRRFQLQHYHLHQGNLTLFGEGGLGATGNLQIPLSDRCPMVGCFLECQPTPRLLFQVSIWRTGLHPKIWILDILGRFDKSWIAGWRGNHRGTNQRKWWTCKCHRRRGWNRWIPPRAHQVNEVLKFQIYLTTTHP